jgi:hypothetical protein
MIRRDYIIRLIEEFGLLWARLIEHIRGGNVTAARLSLDHAYMHTLGLTPDSIHTLTPGDLLARMQLGFPPDVGRERCLILVALLYAEGNLAIQNAKPGTAAELYRSALLILRVTNMDAADSGESHEYVPTIAQLETAIAAITP